MISEGQDGEAHVDPFEYHRFLRNVKEFVLENLDMRITLHDAARVACKERTHLSRIFRKCTGQTFHRWLIGTRLEAARRLFLGSDATIQEVASAVWYGELRSMERAFRDRLGMSASEYRRSCRRQIL